MRRRSAAPSIDELILNRLDAIDGKLDKLNNDHVQRVTALETRIEPLFDNGQPGQISSLDSRLHTLEEARWKQVGFVAGIAAVVTYAGQFISRKLGL